MLYQDVLGLEVSVDDTQGMEVFQSTEDLGEVEPNCGRGENAVSLAVAEDVEVRAGAVRDRPGHQLRSLESAQKAGKEGVLVGRVGRGEPGEKLDFQASTTFRIVLGFLDGLEGEGGARSGVIDLVVDKEDGAHGAFAKDFQGFEVVQVKFRR